jgi:hypothetical protein
MIAARGETKALGRGLEQSSRFRVHRRACVEPAANCESIAGDSALMRVSFSLGRSGALDTAPYRGGGISITRAAQIAEGNGADCDVHVDSVSQGSRDARVVALDVGRAAAARSARVRRFPARAWIRGADQSETCRIRDCLSRSSDYDFRVFHWLSQSIEHMAREFQHLV